MSKRLDIDVSVHCMYIYCVALRVVVGYRGMFRLGRAILDYTFALFTYSSKSRGILKHRLGRSHCCCEICSLDMRWSRVSLAFSEGADKLFVGGHMSNMQRALSGESGGKISLLSATDGITTACRLPILVSGATGAKPLFGKLACVTMEFDDEVGAFSSPRSFITSRR